MQREAGVYLFECENRPTGICKIGNTAHFPRRFGELCSQDMPETCIFRLCVSVRLRIPSAQVLADDYAAIRTEMHALEQWLLNCTDEQNAAGMRQEWRAVSDVDELVEEIKAHVENVNEADNPCWCLAYRHNYRPDVPDRSGASGTFGSLIDGLAAAAPVPDAESVGVVAPRDQQQAALRVIYEYLLHHRCAHIVQACGVGKALLCIFLLQWICQREPSSVHLFVIAVPSKQLVRQMVNEARRVFADCSILCVCSEAIHPHPHTTRSADIRAWDTAHRASMRIIVTTYASCGRVASATLQARLRVADECHHLARHPDHRPSSDRSYQAFWDIQARQSFFMTATPLYVDVEEAGTMSEVARFGERLIDCDRSVKWAIENDCITDYDVMVADHNANTVDAMIDRLFPDEEIDDAHKQLFLSALLALKAMVQYAGERCTHTLIYTNSIEEADRVNDCLSLIIRHRLIDGIPCSVYHASLHSNTPSLSAAIDSFRTSEFGIVPCVFLFGEGFDMVELDAVCIASRMHAFVRIVQSVLRPNRKNPAKPDKRAMVMMATADFDAYEPGGSGAVRTTAHDNVRVLLDALRDEDDACDGKLRLCDMSDDPDGAEPRRAASDSPFLLTENEEKLRRFKIKMMRAGTANPAARKQKEYAAMRRCNAQQRTSSVEAYNRLQAAHPAVYPADPKSYFDTKQAMHENTWKGWSDFLGHDTSRLPTCTAEWRRTCAERDLHTASEYTQLVNAQPHGAPLGLPHEPEDYFLLQNAPFISLTAELTAVGRSVRSRRRR